MSRRGIVALLALMTGLTPSPASPRVAAATFPVGFSDSLIAAIGAPTALAFAPGGRLFVTTQSGVVRLIKYDVLQSGSALDISARTCSNSERGLLGIAVEPGVSVEVVSGRQLAIVSSRGPDGGRAQVRIDGRLRGTIDLYRARSEPRAIVFTAALPPGRHFLVLRATGTAHSRSRGTRVVLDAMVLLTPRAGATPIAEVVESIVARRLPTRRVH